MELQFSCAYDRFCIKLEVQLIMFSRMSTIAILQLAIMNHTLILLDDEVRRRAKMSAWVRPLLSADRGLQFGHYDQLIRAPRMENSSSFRLVPEQRAPASARIVELASDHSFRQQ